MVVVFTGRRKKGRMAFARHRKARKRIKEKHEQETKHFVHSLQTQVALLLLSLNEQA